jgi:hypothetical protein
MCLFFGSEEKTVSYYYQNRYYRRRQPSPTTFTDSNGDVQDLASNSIPKRITTVIPLAKKDGNAWATDFLTSIGEAFEKYNRLTEKQYMWLQKIEKQYSEETRKARKKWCDAFSVEMREEMILAAKIQDFNNKQERVGYWKDLVASILANQDVFVPTEKQWNKFVKNKYIQAKIKTYREKPIFPPGSAVTGRAKSVLGSNMALVLNVDHEYPLTHARGGKRYLLLPFGSDKTITCEERSLKKYRG